MHPRKYFKPAKGLRIPDPDAGKAIVPAGGKWVHAGPYWQRRVAEGSGELADTAAESTAPLADAVRDAAAAAFDSGVHITAAIGLALMATAAVLAAVVLRRVPKAT